MKDPTHAIRFRNNWDGQGDIEYRFVYYDTSGIPIDCDSAKPLFEFVGDEILQEWPLTQQQVRIAELEAELADAGELIKTLQNNCGTCEKLNEARAENAELKADNKAIIEFRDRIISKLQSQVRCCRNCMHYWNASICGACAYSMNDPKDGKNLWEEKEDG